MPESGRARDCGSAAFRPRCGRMRRRLWRRWLRSWSLGDVVAILCRTAALGISICCRKRFQQAEKFDECRQFGMLTVLSMASLRPKTIR